ncbi:hypothetical protein C8242_09400 [Paracidovorax avenae]|nr:hypothetical protein C8242_09400 [Paracidovorax avenae]
MAAHPASEFVQDQLAIVGVHTGQQLLDAVDLREGERFGENQLVRVRPSCCRTFRATTTTGSSSLY